MGGAIFHKGANPLYTPRMPARVWKTVRDECHARLRDLFVVVATPIPSPDKHDFGDVDFLVALPRADAFPSADALRIRKDLPDDLLQAAAAAIGATRTELAKGTSSYIHAAVPWPNSLLSSVPPLLPGPGFVGPDFVGAVANPAVPPATQAEQDGPNTAVEAAASPLGLVREPPRQPPPPPQAFTQIDLRIYPDIQSLQWQLFKHAHGDMWTILGSTIRPFGLIADDTGLHLKIPEIEKFDHKRAKVFLTSEPAEVLTFLGLGGARCYDDTIDYRKNHLSRKQGKKMVDRDDDVWSTRFLSKKRFFQYASSGRLFRTSKAVLKPPPFSAKLRKDLTNNKSQSSDGVVQYTWAPEQTWSPGVQQAPYKMGRPAAPAGVGVESTPAEADSDGATDDFEESDVKPSEDASANISENETTTKTGEDGTVKTARSGTTTDSKPTAETTGKDEDRDDKTNDSSKDVKDNMDRLTSSERKRFKQRALYAEFMMKWYPQYPHRTILGRDRWTLGGYRSYNTPDSIREEAFKFFGPAVRMQYERKLLEWEISQQMVKIRKEIIEELVPPAATDAEIAAAAAGQAGVKPSTAGEGEAEALAVEQSPENTQQTPPPSSPSSITTSGQPQELLSQSHRGQIKSALSKIIINEDYRLGIVPEKPLQEKIVVDDETGEEVAGLFLEDNIRDFITSRWREVGEAAVAEWMRRQMLKEPEQASETGE